MKIALVILALVLLMVACLYASARFYVWAWAIEFDSGMIYLKRPVGACFGLAALIAGVSLAFGPLLALPLERMMK